MKSTNAITIGGVKIVIGNNAVQAVGQEAVSLGFTKAFVVMDKGIFNLGLHLKVLESMEAVGIPYEIYDEVPSDPPIRIVEEGTVRLKNSKCNGVIAIGGGSVMDAAKAINMMSRNEGSILDYDNSPTGGKKFKEPGYPLISIPTTSGTGSEVTQYVVITSETEKRKATIGDSKLVSKVAILDPYLTVGLPKQITASTGIDALAHAIEAYTSNRIITVQGSSVFSDTYALKAIELIGRNLKQAYAQGAVIEARKNVMLGSAMAGLISQAGSGAAHGMGTPLGAHYHVSHGEAVGIMLPYVMEFNLNACLERYRDIAKALGEDTSHIKLEEAAYASVLSVKSLLEAIEFPALKNYVPEPNSIELLAKDAAKDKCCQINAREIGEKQAQELYLKAWKKL